MKLCEVKTIFTDATKISQFRSTQFFAIDYPRGTLLVSYSTIVGVIHPMLGTLVTTEFYSVTTSRQINRYLKEEADCAYKRIDQDLVDSIATSIRYG